MAVARREKGSSIARVLEIIELVSRAERPMSPADIAHELDIPKPSVHRLLQQLEKDGFLQMDCRTLWIPGPRLNQLAHEVFHNDTRRLVRRSILERLAATIGETCVISLRSQMEMTYSDRAQANWPLHIHLPVGARVPIWCTASGKLLLALMPEEERVSLVRNLPLTRMARNTVTDPEAFLALLEQLAYEELGIDNEEFVDGMVAVSVPIKDQTGRAFAFLAVHAPLIRTSLDQLKSFVPMLRDAAAELSTLP